MSGTTTPDLGDFFSDKSRTLAPAAVASQVALMSVVSVVTVVVFNLLRPKNKLIYEPKVKYHEGNKPPPRISSHLFGWLPPLVNTKEPELLDKIGLDAVAFLRFNRLLRQLFSGVVLLAVGVLVPINVSYNLRNVDEKQRDLLSMLTIRDVSGDFLFAHVAVTYLITFVIIAAVWYHWKQMIRLRHTWFRSPEYLQSFYARTLQVLHVPKKYQSDQGLQDIFNRLGMPYPTTSVHIGRKVGRLPELIDYHNETVREFEQVLVGYLKDGKIRAKRPTKRVGATMGCGGVTKDAINFYTDKLKRTEAAIEEYRTQIDTRKAENYGFASLAAVPYAHIVAHKLEGKSPHGTRISLAPNPKDIIWTNMNKSDGEIARKKMLGVLWLVVVCFFNTVPLFIISVLANLEGIRAWVPFLDTWFNSSPESFTFVSGVLPATISGIFGFFLPIIMRHLTKYMGSLTYSRLDRAVIARYFAFLIISQLIIFTLIGVLFNSVKEIVIQIGDKKSFQEILNNLHKLPARIHYTYVNQASYWLTYFPLRGFLVVFDLAQIINLVWLSFKKRVFGRTPRDVREWTQPPEFQYGVYYSNLLFMAAVGLVFAPLAPLVAVAACIVFWMGSWVYKYQLMFVYVSKVESGGRVWNVVVNRLLFCVVLMQCLMILTIGLQKGFRTLLWISALPPVLFIIIFKIYINHSFVPAFRYFTPTEEEIRIAKVHSERADQKSSRLEKRFGHPALHTELFTPMLHANMMPLLSQVYSGKIKDDKARLDEYGGQRMAAQIMPGGIKIAAISAADLEYDPVMYQRDRGELDWDQRSIASTNMLDGGSTYHGHHGSPSVSKLHGYLNHGPSNPNAFASDIELTPVDSMKEHLLSPHAMAFQQQGFESSQSLHSPGSMYQGAPNESSRELYRPQDRAYSPAPTYSDSQHTLVSPSGYPESYSSHQYPPQHGRQLSSNMLHQQGRASPVPNQAYSGRASPGPNQAYAGRASPGPNQMYAGRASPAPNQAYGGRMSPGTNQAYGPGRMSPGPNQAYGGDPYANHGRQPSANMLGAPANQVRSQSPMVQQQQQQQHARQASGNMLQQQPSPGAPNHAGRGAFGR